MLSQTLKDSLFGREEPFTSRRVFTFQIIITYVNKCIHWPHAQQNIDLQGTQYFDASLTDSLDDQENKQRNGNTYEEQHQILDHTHCWE